LGNANPTGCVPQTCKGSIGNSNSVAQDGGPTGVRFDRNSPTLISSDLVLLFNNRPSDFVFLGEIIDNDPVGVIGNRPYTIYIRSDPIAGNAIVIGTNPTDRDTLLHVS
jgi:hypothetical protein